MFYYEFTKESFVLNLKLIGSCVPSVPLWFQRILQENIKKKMIVGTSDGCSMSLLSKQPSNLAYHIEDCQIFGLLCSNLLWVDKRILCFESKATRQLVCFLFHFDFKLPYPSWRWCFQATVEYGKFALGCVKISWHLNFYITVHFRIVRHSS